MDVVGAIIWDITKCSCVGAKKEADYIRRLGENLELLEEKWEDLRSMKEDLKTRVDDAENTGHMQRTHEVDRWLKKADNIQQEITVIQVEGVKVMQERCLGKYCPKNCKSSHKVGKKAAKMLENVDQLATEGKRFSKNFKIAHTIPPEPIEMPQDEVVGLDLMFNEVWKSIEEENVGIIGLHGMGGVGKTTLLKRINNELGKRRQEFDFVMWVVVSKEPNLDSIMDNIRKLVRIEDSSWNGCSNQDEKAAKIYRVLKQKKFALLVDDMWDEMDLSLVGVPRPGKTNFQSKVLFTTRSENVCTKMQAERTFKVETLTEEEATKLFYMKVGDDTLRSNPSIPKLAKKMAKECKRLPLALIVVGSAMAGVKSVEAWEHSTKNLTSSSLTAPDLEKKVFSVLKFSYDRLDEVQKRCFLYCALYPEDCEIRVLHLIDRWMLEKFLYKDMTKSVQDMYGHGESIIEKFKLLCLLESGEDDLYMDRTIKMHDMIRDMALWIAHDQENVEFMQRVSIMNYWESQKIRDPPNATTVVLLKRNHASHLEDIKYMKRLKVLDIKVRGTSFSNIGGLVSLEYLSVFTDILKPEFLNNLRYLTNLKLLSLHAYTRSFPLGVLSSLQQLRVVRLFRIKYSEERGILEELECLPNIEELRIEIWRKDGLKKLLESTKLQSCIYSLWSGISNENDEMPLSFASLSKMKQLREFHLELLKIRREQYSFVFDTGCLTKLRSVTIGACSVTHATWLKYAPLLQELEISDCDSVEEVIREEEDDEDYSIKNNENVDSSSSIFSSLVTLYLYDLPRLQSIHKAPLPFPSLRSITIVWCRKLNKLPLDSNSAKHKLIDISGPQDWWDKLEWDDPAAKHKFQSKFKPSF
ncbi:probable disease resistance protein At5g63020 [Neltuma alba]|uniref:probable disease resistance protein At5g63020 n=1 Tax=Neltuma alba TaxID=207710 RepID=UPI0010A54571|nr:probable disease resistance protein At5g63020 [Prosopis alba]XP_028775878.1 probable disease resistance protein At5g63020 [Prosopis alba]XP_028775879.1 probable disease resistance protein At5g63020 [Prosopis alba]XP_028775880.1 probable disease resistance protein At5g63020 [Prosopis alba]